MSPLNYVLRLRRRSRLRVALRAGIGSLLVFLTGFGLFALWVGPASGWAQSIAAFTLSLGATLGFGVLVGLLPFRALDGFAAANHLLTTDPKLVGPLRSAAELQMSPNGSQELVDAHRDAVAARLLDLPADARRPPSPWADPWAGALFVMTVLVAVGLFTSERALVGVYALTHPGQAIDGTLAARVFDQVDVELVFPEYMGRPNQQLVDVVRVEAPVGTTLLFHAQSRVDVSSGEIQSASQVASMDVDGRSLRGQLTVEEGAPFVLRLVTPDGTALTDPLEREIVVINDDAPVVSLKISRGDEEISDPDSLSNLSPSDEIRIRWNAADDVAISRVDLAVETGSGRVRRTRMSQEQGPTLFGEHRFTVSDFIQEPGARAELWVEARDDNSISGPNTGQSATIVLAIATEHTQREQALEDMTQAIDAGLTALADRLELPESDRPERQPAVMESSEAFAGALSDLVSLPSSSTLEPGTFLAMARRLRRELGKEERARAPARAAAFIRVMEQIENDVLTLSDHMERERAEDAAALARELDRLRRELASLLAELQRADTDEAREALLDAIEMAHQHLRELAARIAELGDAVPSDHANAPEGGNTEVSEDALSAMREAVERGDLEGAERELARLRGEVDRLAQALNAASEETMNARFGPSQQAMAEALDQLAGLEAEQHRLSRRTGDSQRAAADRALRASGGADEGTRAQLAREAEEVLDGLSELSSSGSAVDDELLDRARARTRDTLSALRSGDLGEARSMSAEAGAELEGLSRDLSLSALMFGGQDGENRAASRQAEQLVRQASQLRRGIERTIPNIQDHLEPGEVRQMESDGPRQEQVVEQATRLTELFESSPSGQPLSPEGAAALGEIRQDMAEAQQSLRSRDPLQAADAQSRAAQRLTELREQLEQNQGGGGGQSDQGQESAFDFRDEVVIPGAEAFVGPVGERRRILDAMQAGAAPEFEGAVRRYYEGLLR